MAHDNVRICTTDDNYRLTYGGNDISLQAHDESCQLPVVMHILRMLEHPKFVIFFFLLLYSFVITLNRTVIKWLTFTN